MTGSQLKQIRLYLGYNQQMFAVLLGISRSYLSQLETGTRQISDRVRIQLAKNVKIPADYFESVEQMKNFYVFHEKFA